MNLEKILENHITWLYGSGGKRANLREANLRDADLRGANLREADLRYADLRYANLREANLRYANLRHADLRYADLRGADLRYANLRYANLRHADLWYTNLREADLREANLRDANLREANLRDADLSGIKISRVIGNMMEIKSLQIDTYHIIYTVDQLAIGCEQHSFDKWQNFSDQEINRMVVGAAEFWHQWKDWIFELIEKSPAVDWRKDELA